MATKRRSPEQMQMAILRTAREPEATVSSITQLVSLQWQAWKRLSGDLMKKGMLMQKDGHYRTTAKGLEWLRLREAMDEV